MRLVRSILCLILVQTFQGYNATAKPEQSCRMCHAFEKECGVYVHQVVKPMMTYFEQMYQMSIKNEAEIERRAQEIKQLEEKVSKLQIENIIYKTKEDSMAAVLEEFKHQKISILQQCQCKKQDTQINELKEQIKSDAKRLIEYEANLLSIKEVIQANDIKIRQLETDNQHLINKLKDSESMKEQQNIQIRQIKEQAESDAKTYEQNLLSKEEVIQEKEKRIVQLETEKQNQIIKLKKSESMEEQKNREITELNTKISLGVDKANKCDAEYTNQKAINLANEQQIRELKTEVMKYIEKLREMETNKKAMSCIATDSSGARNVTHCDTFEVPCNSDIAGPGWTIIQQRIGGGVDFKRNWSEYKNGFGDFWDGDFFLGLEKIHRLTTAQPQELYIHMEKFDGGTKFARYSEFAIAGEDSQYSLTKLGSFNGTAVDHLNYNKDMQFSTYERDNDHHYINCSTYYHGGAGWWFNACTNVNLNGVKYDSAVTQVPESIYWGKSRTALKHVKMMIRPKTL